MIGRVSRAYKLWRKVAVEQRAAIDAALGQGLTPPVFPPHPRPIVEGQKPSRFIRDGVWTVDPDRKDFTPRSWSDVMPGKPLDDSNPDTPERIAARERRWKHVPDTFQKPREDPVPGTLIRAARVRGREPGDLVLTLPRRFG